MVFVQLDTTKSFVTFLSFMAWASCQIRQIAGCACAGNAGNVFPRGRLQRKLLVSDLDMHHGTCVTHVPWCMSGSLTYGGGENVPGIPGACAPVILRICQEAHAVTLQVNKLFNNIICLFIPTDWHHFDWQSQVTKFADSIYMVNLSIKGSQKSCTHFPPGLYLLVPVLSIKSDRSINHDEVKQNLEITHGNHYRIAPLVVKSSWTMWAKSADTHTV